MSTELKSPAGPRDSSPAPPQHDSQLRPLLLVAACAAASVVIVLRLIAQREFWLDEYYTAMVADMPAAAAIRWIAGDVHPPLYFLLIGVWSRLFGDGETALRAFSIVMHVAGGLAIYHVARTIFGNVWAAATAALLFLLSPGLLVYAGEARGYSLAVLLLTCAAGALWRLSSGQGERRRAVLLGVLCALAFYTHYITVFVSAGLFFYWLVTSARDRVQRSLMLLSAAICALLTLPWLPVLLRQMRAKQIRDAIVTGSWTDPEALSYGRTALLPDNGTWLPDLVGNLISLTGLYPADRIAVAALLAVPFAIVLLLAGWRTLRGGRVGMLTLIVAALNIGGCLALTLISRRYMIWLTPFIVLTLTLGVLEAGRHRRAALPVALAGVLLLITLAGALRAAASPRPAPLAPVVETIRDHHRSGDLIVFSVLYAQVPFDYHARRLGFDAPRRGFPETVYDWWGEHAYKGWGGPVIHKADLVDFLDRIELEGTRRVWLILFETEHYDPNGRLVAGLAERGWSIGPCPIDQPVCRLAVRRPAPAVVQVSR